MIERQLAWRLLWKPHPGDGTAIQGKDQILTFIDRERFDGYRIRRILRDDVVNDSTRDVGQPEIASRVAIGQPLMIKPKLPQYRRV